MDDVDCVVVGAGVVGLAVARQLAISGRDVLILEAAAAIGTGTSSRNSGIIHAGLYYPPRSLKAKLCVSGRDRLYAYARDRGIPHARPGKLIVATGPDQEAVLASIAENARSCGAGDLTALSAEAARELEPAVACTAALLSPLTGIIDTSSLMLSLLADAEAGGAALALNTRVVAGRAETGRIVLTTQDAGSGATHEIAARDVVNAAGLGAVSLARAIAGLDAALVPALRYAKGNYFALAGRAPFSRMIYPVPVPGGLGVHLTLDLDGAARFGPDVEWTDGLDYRVDPARSASFYAAIRAYWPGLPDGHLQPAYSGIRPKLSGPGEPASDFVIQDAASHGIPGLVNLFGIESPGLTASLSIAEEVAFKLNHCHS